MASSGTVALSIDFRLKPSRGREEALVSGKGKIKSTAVIEANDLELRTIKAFSVMPYYIEPTAGGTYFGGAGVLYGSVNTSGSLMNAVTLKTMKGSHDSLAGGSGTAHVGTVPAGSMQLSFIAIGA